MRRTIVFISLLCAACGHLGGGADPVTSDPETIDRDHPAALMGTSIESGGAQMNGIVYMAAGPGPHPTVILLHGYPGEERNLDLAQAIRRSGRNVLFFHYRGAWGSEGEYGIANAIEDVEAAIAFAASPAFAEAHRADPARIALVGHSMGGFLALAAGSEQSAVSCIGSIAGANLGRMAVADTATADAAARRLDAMSGPIRGNPGARLVAEIAENALAFDTTRRAPRLATKSLLLVAGTRDRVTPPEVHHDPLEAALVAAGARRLRVARLDADHAFSPRRVALARNVVDWLDESCDGPPQ